MSAALAEKRKWTAAEYLEMERSAPEKHEFFDGEIFAMAGATYEHNVIVSNLIIALGNALGDKCIVFPSDMRIFIPATGGYVYPDVSVLCGEPDFTDDHQDTITNPEAIFSVLSESTEKYDRATSSPGTARSRHTRTTFSWPRTRCGWSTSPGSLGAGGC